MEFELLKTVEQFEELKKGELIIVKWSDNWVRHTPKSKHLTAYNIYENKTIGNNTEIICQKKGNHYFNYMIYLNGEGSAVEVYKITT